MNKESELVIKLIQRDIRETLDAGVIQDARAQYMFLDNILQKLLLLHESEILKKVNIHGFYDDQFRILGKIEELQRQVNELTEEYSKNAKEIYDGIKRL